MAFDELPYATFGSASIPFVWPPTPFRDHLLIDGGSVFNINIESAIKQCMDGVVDNESDIILDIVICADKGENTGGKVSSNAALNFITGVKENRFYHNIQSI